MDQARVQPEGDGLGNQGVAMTECREMRMRGVSVINGDLRVVQCGMGGAPGLARTEGSGIKRGWNVTRS